MKKKIRFLLFCTALFFACQSTDIKENKLKSIDTMKIISSILNGREFLKENPNFDTVFFLRNKLFTGGLLKGESSFKIASLEDNSRTRMINIGPGFPYDGRERLSVVKFEYKDDTVKFNMYEHGGNLFYDTDLISEGKDWIILKQNVYNGGRLEKFEFEDEEWYKELKKKTSQDKLNFQDRRQKYN